MTIWMNCLCDIYYQDDAPALRDPGYQIRIDADELVISYESEDGWVNYKGKDLGGGHYALVADTVEGRGMLHRAPESDILEGCWEENGAFGMWRLYLGD